MMRGYRWQVIALLLALAVFALVLLTRSSQSTVPTSPTQQATANSTATALVVDLSPTLPPNATTQPQFVSTDGIPTYREALVGEVNRLNPIFAPANPVDRDISSLIFEGLTTTNTYGEPVPALADHWVVSSDGLEYVVYLRDDVLWHDGVPFTAQDVVYTMSLLRSPDFPGPAELHEFWRSVETQALSDSIVRFRLTQPLGIFPDRLQVGILPAHALEGISAAQITTHPFNLSPIGTGPYQLENLRSNGTSITEVNLRAAPVYRQRRAEDNALLPERVQFQIFDTFDEASLALQNGEVDSISAPLRSEREPLFMIANEANLPMQSQLENSLGVLIFNWQNENTRFFRDQRVRVALAAGLDRDAVIERAMPNAAVSADSPLMPGSWAYQSELPWPAYDPARARELLEQAAERINRLDGEGETAAVPPPSDQVAPGAEPTATFTPTPPPNDLFTFSILVPDDPSLISVAQEIAAQWSQLGIAVSVDAVPVDVYQQRLDSGEFDTAIVEYGLGDSADPDVYGFWHQGQYPDGENYGGVDDLRISVLLERARRDSWGVNRAADYEQFQQEFAERVIALPLYYPIFTYVNSARVNGIQLGFMGTPADRFRNIEDWSLAS